MKYLVEILKKENQNTSTWSGGTTTQLAIYPPDSEYKKRNFKWRLSSACVEIEESTFTSVPGIWRHIMIIEGKMELQHEGHHSVILEPYGTDSFSGGWTTKSRGKARDFNLMLSEEYRGELQAIFVGNNTNVQNEVGSSSPEYRLGIDAFYCAAGSVRAEASKEEVYELQQGDLMLISNYRPGDSDTITFACTNDADAVVIWAKISYK